MNHFRPECPPNERFKDSRPRSPSDLGENANRDSRVPNIADSSPSRPAAASSTRARPLHLPLPLPPPSAPLGPRNRHAHKRFGPDHTDRPAKQQRLDDASTSNANSSSSRPFHSPPGRTSTEFAVEIPLPSDSRCFDSNNQTRDEARDEVCQDVLDKAEQKYGMPLILPYRDWNYTSNTVICRLNHLLDESPHRPDSRYVCIPAHPACLKGTSPNFLRNRGLFRFEIKQRLCKERFIQFDDVKWASAFCVVELSLKQSTTQRADSRSRIQEMVPDIIRDLEFDKSVVDLSSQPPPTHPPPPVKTEDLAGPDLRPTSPPSHISDAGFKEPDPKQHSLTPSSDLSLTQNAITPKLAGPDLRPSSPPLHTSDAGYKEPDPEQHSLAPSSDLSLTQKAITPKLPDSLQSSAPQPNPPAGSSTSTSISLETSSGTQQEQTVADSGLSTESRSKLPHSADSGPSSAVTPATEVASSQQLSKSASTAVRDDTDHTPENTSNPALEESAVDELADDTEVEIVTSSKSKNKGKGKEKKPSKVVISTTEVEPPTKLSKRQKKKMKRAAAIANTLAETPSHNSPSTSAAPPINRAQSDVASITKRAFKAKHQVAYDWASRVKPSSLGQYKLVSRQIGFSEKRGYMILAKRGDAFSAPRPNATTQSSPERQLIDCSMDPRDIRSALWCESLDLFVCGLGFKDKSVGGIELLRNSRKSRKDSRYIQSSLKPHKHASVSSLCLLSQPDLTNVSLISAGADHKLVHWNFDAFQFSTSTRCSPIPGVPHKAEVTAVGVCGQNLLSSGLDKRIASFGISQNGAPVFSSASMEVTGVSGLTFQAGALENIFAAEFVAPANQVAFYDVRACRLRPTVPAPATMHFSYEGSKPSPLTNGSFSPDGQKYALAVDEDLHVWDLRKPGQPMQSHKGRSMSSFVQVFWRTPKEIALMEKRHLQIWSV